MCTKWNLDLTCDDIVLEKEQTGRSRLTQKYIITPPSMDEK